MFRLTLLATTALALAACGNATSYPGTRAAVRTYSAPTYYSTAPTVQRMGNGTVIDTNGRVVGTAPAPVYAPTYSTPTYTAPAATRTVYVPVYYGGGGGSSYRSDDADELQDRIDDLEMQLQGLQDRLDDLED